MEHLKKIKSYSHSLVKNKDFFLKFNFRSFGLNESFFLINFILTYQLSSKLRFFSTKSGGVPRSEEAMKSVPRQCFAKIPPRFHDLNTCQGLIIIEMNYNCSYLAEKLGGIVTVLITLVGDGLFLFSVTA